MYKGKYQKSAVTGYRSKMRGLMIISLVLLVTVIVGGTAAFLLDSTGEVTNTFAPADVKVTVDENKNGNTKSDIRFTNPQGANAAPVYIRATLVIYWEDKDGNIVPEPDGGDVQIGAVNEADGWFEVNGIYYYSNKVVPGAQTPNMLKAEISVPNSDAKAEVVVTTVPGYTCYIDVRAEAIQAEPETVVTAAWKGVEIYVDADGNKLLQAK